MESLSAESDSEATGFCKKGGVGGHMSSPFSSRKVRMSLTRFYTCRFSMALKKLHPEQNSLDLAEFSKHDPENSGIWWVKEILFHPDMYFICVHPYRLSFSEAEQELSGWEGVSWLRWLSLSSR